MNSSVRALRLRLRPLFCGLFSLGLGAGAPAAFGDPFDPSGYIGEREAEKAAKAEELSGQAVVRINGQRYLKFSSSDGAVYLPSTGTAPEVQEMFAVCPDHLGLMREVLPLRSSGKIDQAAKKEEKAIIELIRKCREGRIKGPVVTEKQPDGAVVEIKAKEKPQAPEKAAGGVSPDK